MYCPACHGYNGDFAVRCQHCGRVFTQVEPATRPDQSNRRSGLTSLLAAATLLSTVLVLGLAGLITERNLWPQLVGETSTETAAALAPAKSLGRSSLSDAANVAPARPAQPTTLDVGQSGMADRWRFVVDRATFAPDDLENGWWQSIVTYTIQNASDRTARLDIPSTAAVTSSNERPSQNGPNFVPLPSVP